MREVLDMAIIEINDEMFFNGSLDDLLNMVAQDDLSEF